VFLIEGHVDVGAHGQLESTSNLDPPILEWSHRKLANDHAFSGGAQAPSAATRG
jgi:hypothetical protein